MNPLPRFPAAAVASLLTAAPLARAADTIDLKPLVNDKTFLVVRFAPNKVKVTALPAWLQQTFKDSGMPNDLVQPRIKELNSGAREFQRIIDIFDKAGITQAAFVMNFEATPQGRPDALPMLVAITADPDAITKQLQGIIRKTVLADVEGVSVWSFQAPAEYVTSITPADRPELLGKVDTLGDSAVIAALAINEPTKQAMLNSTGGRDPVQLPVPISPTGNLIAASGKVETTDGPHAVVTADFKDVKQAQQFLNSLLAMAPATKALQTSPLTVAGSSITLDARQPAFTAIAADLKPALERAQLAANRIKSMSNMRQLMLACIMYANDNKGALPPAITDLGKYTGTRDGKTQAAILTNPQRPDLKDAGYVYVRAPEGDVQAIRKSADRLAIYEAGDFDKGLNVAFWDGHVEFVQDKGKFDALLAAAQAPAK